MIGKVEASGGVGMTSSPSNASSVQFEPSRKGRCCEVPALLLQKGVFLVLAFSLLYESRNLQCLQA